MCWSLVSMVSVVATLLAGCAPQPPVTKKVDGYSGTVTAADIIFVDDPKFHESLKSSTSGSIYGHGGAASMESEMTAYARRVAAELQPKVKASGIGGQVSVLPPNAVKNAVRSSTKALVIAPVGGQTTCSPCYSVITFRSHIFDNGQLKPSWSTDVKVVVSRSDSVDQLWNNTAGALRSDGLLPEGNTEKATQ